MLFPEVDEGALFVCRSDLDELLGTYSPHVFSLDGLEWPTVEHYFQAMKFAETAPEHFEKVRLSTSAKQARKLGRSKSIKIRVDWSKVRRVVMTRAIYTKCRTHDEVAQVLIDSGERKILENSQYDYYWGCGRDRRAENTFGLVLMDVRTKLLEEAS